VTIFKRGRQDIGTFCHCTGYYRHKSWSKPGGRHHEHRTHTTSTPGPIGGGLYRLLKSDEDRQILQDQKALVSKSKQLATRVWAETGANSTSLQNERRPESGRLQTILDSTFCVMVVVSISSSVWLSHVLSVACFFKEALFLLSGPHYFRASSTPANPPSSTHCWVKKSCLPEFCRPRTVPSLWRIRTICRQINVTMTTIRFPCTRVPFRYSRT
jgi:hypothetical protein